MHSSVTYFFPKVLSSWDLSITVNSLFIFNSRESELSKLGGRFFVTF